MTTAYFCFISCCVIIPIYCDFAAKIRKRFCTSKQNRNKLGILFICEDRQSSLHRNIHLVSFVTFSVKHLDFSTILCIFAARILYTLDMSKYEIPFLTACIQAFGKRFSMTRQAAFRYLHKHKGLEFLIEFYDVEHLQSMDETIEDLLIICQKNGGTLA